MRYDLGPANWYAGVCFSRLRFLPLELRDEIRKEGVWEDLVQEIYTTAWEAREEEMDRAETCRFAQRRIYRFLLAYGYRPYHNGFFKLDRPFSVAFPGVNIADRGLAPPDPDVQLLEPIISGDHLDERILELLRNNPQAMTRADLAMRLWAPVDELKLYLASLLGQNKIIEVKRENCRGRPRSPLYLIVGAKIPEQRMVKTERDERIRQAYFVEGKSIKQINRELHHDKRTIRRAIHRSPLDEAAQRQTQTTLQPRMY